MAEVTMTAKRRLPDLLVTLVARPTVRSVAGRGTAALMRGMFAWHLTIMPQTCKVTGMGKIQAAAVAPPPAGAAAAAVAAAAAAVQKW